MTTTTDTTTDNYSAELAATTRTLAAYAAMRRRTRSQNDSAYGAGELVAALGAYADAADSLASYGASSPTESPAGRELADALAELADDAADDAERNGDDDAAERLRSVRDDAHKLADIAEYTRAELAELTRAADDAERARLAAYVPYSACVCGARESAGESHADACPRGAYVLAERVAYSAERARAVLATDYAGELAELACGLAECLAYAYALALRDKARELAGYGYVNGAYPYSDDAYGDPLCVACLRSAADDAADLVESRGAAHGARDAVAELAELVQYAYAATIGDYAGESDSPTGCASCGEWISHPLTEYGERECGDTMQLLAHDDASARHSVLALADAYGMWDRHAETIAGATRRESRAAAIVGVLASAYWRDGACEYAGACELAARILSGAYAAERVELASSEATPATDSYRRDDANGAVLAANVLALGDAYPREWTHGAELDYRRACDAAELAAACAELAETRHVSPSVSRAALDYAASVAAYGDAVAGVTYADAWRQGRNDARDDRHAAALAVGRAYSRLIDTLGGMS
jgi:hypothetical protein